MENKNYNPELSPDELHVVEAAECRDKLISLLNAYEIESALGKILEQCYKDLDKKDDGSNEMKIVKFAEEFGKTLRNNKRFSVMTTAEVELSFYWGIRNFWGNWYGLVPATGYFFCNEYLNSNLRKLALFKQNDYLRKISPEAKPDEKKQDQFQFNCAVRKYYEFTRTGVVVDFGNPTYKFLYSLGCIKLTTELFESYKKQAYTAIKIEEQRSKEKDSKYELKKLLITIEGMSSPLVVTEARRLVLVEYFKEIQKKEIVFEEFLKQRLKDFYAENTTE